MSGAAQVAVGVLIGLVALMLLLAGAFWLSESLRERPKRPRPHIPAQRGEHDRYDMTDDERQAEVRWMYALYGPPVIPGRD